jgi:hypothetical protein
MNPDREVLLFRLAQTRTIQRTGPWLERVCAEVALRQRV